MSIKKNILKIFWIKTHTRRFAKKLSFLKSRLVILWKRGVLMRVGIALFFDRSTPMSFASHTTSNQLNRLVIVPHAVPLGSRPLEFYSPHIKVGKMKNSNSSNSLILQRCALTYLHSKRYPGIDWSKGFRIQFKVCGLRNAKAMAKVNTLNKASEVFLAKIESLGADENILVKTIVPERILTLTDGTEQSKSQKLQNKLTSDPAPRHFFRTYKTIR